MQDTINQLNKKNYVKMKKLPNKSSIDWLKRLRECAIHLLEKEQTTRIKITLRKIKRRMDYHIGIIS